MFIGGDEKKKKPKKEKKSAKATPTSSAKATPSKTTKVTIEDVPEDDIEKVSSKIKILNIKKNTVPQYQTCGLFLKKKIKLTIFILNRLQIL